MKQTQKFTSIEFQKYFQQIFPSPTIGRSDCRIHGEVKEEKRIRI